MARTSDGPPLSRVETGLLLGLPIVSGAVLFAVFESAVTRRIGLFLVGAGAVVDLTLSLVGRT